VSPVSGSPAAWAFLISSPSIAAHSLQANNPLSYSASAMANACASQGARKTGPLASRGMPGTASVARRAISGLMDGESGMFEIRLKGSMSPYLRWSSRDALHFGCKIPSGGWSRQGSAFFMVNRDCLFDDLTELVEHFFFIVAMAAPQDQARRAADITLIFIRPFDDFCVLCAVLHFFDSSIASCTALTW